MECPHIHVEDVEVMCMQCGGYVDNVEVMCMLCGYYRSILWIVHIYILDESLSYPVSSPISNITEQFAVFHICFTRSK